jgi:hypothetical protein
MSYDFYKVLHLAGYLAVFFALGGVVFHVASGGNRDSAWRRGAALLHGFGLLIAFVAGFGLIAKLRVGFPWPAWIWIKIGIWLLLGAALTIPYRFPKQVRLLWILLPLVGVLAAYLARYKPF